MCVQDNDGNTGLHVAVLGHRSEAVRILLEEDANPTIHNNTYVNPILAAATTGFYLYEYDACIVSFTHKYRGLCHLSLNHLLSTSSLTKIHICMCSCDLVDEILNFSLGFACTCNVYVHVCSVVFSKVSTLLGSFPVSYVTVL